MKIILLIFSFLLISNSIQAQWTDINPVPEGNTLWSTFFINDSVGWIAGSDGFIKKTTDGGIEWIQQNISTSAEIKSIFFISIDTGWICGEQGILLKTINGGYSWISLNSGTTERLNQIKFYNKLNGIAVGDKGIIIRTTDGGISWSQVYNNNLIELLSADLASDNIFYTTGYEPGSNSPKILKSTDAGINWIDLSSNLSGLVGSLNTVEFVNADTGFAGGGEFYFSIGFILKTTDGGITWQQKSLPLPRNDKPFENHKILIDDEYYGIRAIYFKDENTGFAVGGNGGGWRRVILSTTDAGSTWGLKYHGMEEYGLLSVSVTESGFGIATGFNGSIFRTENNGVNWFQQLSGGVNYGGKEKLNCVSFITDSFGWTGGTRQSFGGNEDGYLLMKTTNGGKLWVTNTYYYDIPLYLRDIFFINENFGWIATSDGIQYTTDAGNTWGYNNQITSVSSIFFIDHNTGWLLSDNTYFKNNKSFQVNNVIAKSTDGGVSWTVKSTPGGNSIYFSDSLNGWVAGDNGNIRKTTDGGETWINKLSGTVSDLKSIKFFNNNLGAVAGSNSTFLISTDGGETWLSRNTNTNTAFNSITFIDANSIWLVGDNGTILFTDDLGNTWTNYGNITNKNLKSIYKKNDNSVFIAGHQGAMLRYFNNTQQPPMHFNKNWSGNPYLPMNIYITSAKIENASLKAGDEIAVFSSGNCVGSIRLNDSIPQNGFVQIITSLDDPNTNEVDGFIPNDTIVFKFWNSQTQQEIELVIASYTQGTGRFIQQGTSVVNLNGYNYLTQSVGLTGGWNIISLNVQPDNINMMSIFNSLISGDVLIKVQDETGNAIEKLPEPIGWINNIGNWSPTEGYYTKIQPNSAASLITTGIKVPLPQNIILTNGWNIISYPVQTEQNALLILQDLINNGKLVKVQDEAGNAIEYLPEPIGWINNIGNFKPGEGYYLKVNSIASLTYTESALPKSIELNKNIIAEKNNTSHFTQIWSDNPYLPMNIYVTDFNLPDGSSLIQGDEIGIFYSDICIGAAQISQNDINRGYVQIILSADDPTTIETDGFVAGNSIIVNVWKANQNQFITISNPVFLSGSEFFEPLGTSVIRFNTVIPVELISFGALVNNSDVRLSWSTSTELNNRGFEIERGQKPKVKSQIDWESIGFINGKGTTTETQNYSFADKNLLPGKYYYRLKQIDFDGKFSFSGMIEVNVDLPTEFALEQNYPNPFNPTTKISWQSPVGSWQTLKVFDILGNEVATLVDEYKEPGRYEVEFDASDLSSGVYIYRLQADAFISTKKMVLLR
ncbi:YCF48-related protein [Ignavibacterium sp.]|uniref:YCF48-related protein n=1 Tax=Ignavibacterium sp. TaxID=2651167 RepID=UPI0021FBCB01|nr:YCF48-related protein [Ignavibacterium sp.]BDQ02785.1 MAG: hypothetical protein KatS3mg037_1360 [Ignavibacterium sp.]